MKNRNIKGKRLRRKPIDLLKNIVFSKRRWKDSDMSRRKNLPRNREKLMKQPLLLKRKGSRQSKLKKHSDLLENKKLRLNT